MCAALWRDAQPASCSGSVAFFERFAFRVAFAYSASLRSHRAPKGQTQSRASGALAGPYAACPGGRARRRGSSRRARPRRSSARCSARASRNTPRAPRTARPTPPAADPKQGNRFRHITSPAAASTFGGRAAAPPTARATIRVVGGRHRLPTRRRQRAAAVPVALEGHGASGGEAYAVTLSSEAVMARRAPLAHGGE